MAMVLGKGAPLQMPVPNAGTGRHQHHSQEQLLGATGTKEEP